MSKPIDSNGNVQTASSAISLGCAGDIVVVRLMYQWPVYVSLLGLNLADTAGSKAAPDVDRRVPQRAVWVVMCTTQPLTSTVAFRNEPYGSPC